MLGPCLDRSPNHDRLMAAVPPSFTHHPSRDSLSKKSYLDKRIQHAPPTVTNSTYADTPSTSCSPRAYPQRVRHIPPHQTCPDRTQTAASVPRPHPARATARSRTRPITRPTAARSPLLLNGHQSSSADNATRSGPSSTSLIALSPSGGSHA